MKTQTAGIGNTRVEILSREDGTYVGLGKVWIGDTLVRSGRLPIRPYTQSYKGSELASLTLDSVAEGRNEIRIKVAARFRPLEVKIMRDHSFDPIHDTGDWSEERTSGSGTFEVVVKSASRTFNGVQFDGFSYHYEYKSSDVPLFYILDKASWELGGDIAGTTIYSQSACSDPDVTIEADTLYTTEGIAFFLDEATHPNRNMTHNLPRWASHQAFDYQFRGSETLIGVFDHVDLIRSVVERQPGEAELKTFDKHIFDESLQYKTSAKSILLSTTPKTLTGQRNLWTWIFDEVHRSARAEFGLREVPAIPTLGHHYWVNVNIDTYYKDIVPTVASLGYQAIFVENFKKSDASEPIHLPGGNMCCSHEYEIADSKGGFEKFKDYVDRCHKKNIKSIMWTNPAISLCCDMNGGKPETQGWFITAEDTRTKYGGAYTAAMSILDFNNPDARRYFTDTHKKLAKETGLDGYYIDSFYNMYFMPVSYTTGHPNTVWRESLEVMKELQDAGVSFYIESFGPFGQPGHGHPASYDIDSIFIAYYVGLGNGYTTVPIPGSVTTKNFKHDPAYLFYQFAHKAPNGPPLFIDGVRADEAYGVDHRRVVADYHNLLPGMHTRYLQEDNLSVLWHDEAGKQTQVWNFTDRTVRLPGQVTCLTTGETLPAAETYALKGAHVYGVEGKITSVSA